MKTLFRYLLVVLLVAGCAPATPDQGAIETALAQTLEASAEGDAQNEPTKTQPAPTNNSAPTNTPAPTQTPEPTKTPAPTKTSTPWPDPIIIEGEGDSVVNVDKWDGPALMRINSPSSQGNFIVRNYGEDGDQIDLLVNTIGEYEGIVPLDFLVDEQTTRIQVESDDVWLIIITPLTIEYLDALDVPGTFDGNGDNVVFLKGTPDLATFKSEERDNFIVYAFGDRRKLIVNEIGPYDGTVIVPRDTTLLVINTSGPWSVDVTAP